MAHPSMLLHRPLASLPSNTFFFLPATLALFTTLFILLNIFTTPSLFISHQHRHNLKHPLGPSQSSPILPSNGSFHLSAKFSSNDVFGGEDGTGSPVSSRSHFGSKGNSMNDTDVFHDGDIFLEDYQQMNRSFKIYVYPHRRDDPFAHAFLPVDFEPGGNYASESYFKKALMNSHFITEDPRKADLFFLPFSIARLRHDRRVGGGGLQSFIRDYISNISTKYPYWNRTGGADHFYVACHSIGRSAMAKAEEVKLNAIQVVCSSSYFLPGYAAHKDASLPQVWPRTEDPPTITTSERNKLAFFAGAINSPVREKLLKFWRNDSEIYAHFGRLKTPYADELLGSKFCLHVKGFEVNTARIADSLYYGCVPIILANYYDLPFADILNWKSFSIGVVTVDIPLLKKILRGITSDEYSSLRGNVLKKSYEDMKIRIESIRRLGKVPADIRKEHKGFDEWDFVLGPHDHPSILQILIDGRDPNAIDVEGKALPTLVYLAREKRPQIHHNFKAGALNALIRVSSRISNAPFILNVDCDMYSNNSKAIRDALCFFLDEENGCEIAYVQYPQTFDNLTKNEIYGSLRVVMKLELAGFDGNGGPCYIGTGCVHRRESLCGMKYSKQLAAEWKAVKYDRKIIESASSIEENCKALASCTYEENTPWGKEMGVKYGCVVEDILTGIFIQSRGWRTVYLIPQREAFLGMVPTTLLDTFVQHKRWAEGDFQIFLSKHCPFVYGCRNMPLKLQLSYCIYLLWAPNCFATLYYVFVPSFCLLKGISLFPKISSSWGIPYLYVIVVHRVHSLVEFVWLGGTVRGWLNEQRMWMFKRTTSYFFAAVDNILKLCGFSKSAFIITGKVADDDINRRYEQESMEFGTSSPMFTVLATLALFNLFGLIVVGTNKATNDDGRIKVFDIFGCQILLCCVLVFVNLPIYQGMFFRKDRGKIPASVTLRSIAFALLASTLAMY